MSFPPPRALRIARLDLQVADLGAAVAFYRDAVGFTLTDDSPGRSGAIMRLGGRELALISADPAAAPYPAPRAANDPWFQHFAIAVSDIAAAFEAVRRSKALPISRGGPQLLPPNTGSVTAYKFRDPEGHPLELFQAAGGSSAPPGSVPGPFLAIDQTALAVRDLGAAEAFYTAVLGLSRVGQSLNRGPEQDRLDGLQGAQVDIVALATAGDGPHVELLHYRSPTPSTPREVGPRDLAATRTRFEVDDLRWVTGALDARRWPWAAVGGALLLQDVDGHRLEVKESPRP